MMVIVCVMWCTSEIDASARTCGSWQKAQSVLGCGFAVCAMPAALCKIKCTQTTLRNPRQKTAFSVQFVPGMRFLVFDFGVYMLDADFTGKAVACMRFRGACVFVSQALCLCLCLCLYLCLCLCLCLTRRGVEPGDGSRSECQEEGEGKGRAGNSQGRGREWKLRDGEREDRGGSYTGKSNTS
eukprot:626610-Rhodomonas_salina.3